jgi:fucose 4-O-acetylase-like acetyltransferase
VKAIAIILVVYRHVLIGIQRAGLDIASYWLTANEVVYSFRMPLFFMLSGLFFAKSLVKRTTGKFIGNKFDTILYPYFIWVFIQVTVQVVLSNYTNADRGLIDYAYILYQPRSIDQFWYLYALFNVSVVFALVYRYLTSNAWVLGILSVVMFQLSVLVEDIGLLHDLLYYFLFFYLGHLLSDVLLNPERHKIFYSVRLFLVLLPFFALTQWYWLTHQDMPLLLFAVISVLGSLFMINLAFLLAVRGWFPWLKVIGFHSLYIYVMHVLITAAVRIFFTNILHLRQPETILFLNIIIGSVLPVLLYNFMVQNGFRFLFHPPKKKKNPAASEETAGQPASPPEQT